MDRREERGLIKFVLKAVQEPSLICIICGMSSALFAQSAFAFDIETDNPDLKLRWDNTVRYSTAWRVKGQSPLLINSPPATTNQDDGDRSFNKGLISNRLDLFSEFDASFRNFGARVSGAAWYDDIYNSTNDNNSPSTVNAVSVPFNHFTKTARDLHGRKAEILDAFIYGKGELGEMAGTFRLGRHALLWGESLFFGNNGIAGTQSSVDIIKLSSVPNSLFKETIRPDDQVSGQLQITSDLAIGAYYKFSWEKNRLPVAGSYFASTDIINGGERLIAGAPIIPTGGPRAFFRADDQEAKNSGQGGFEVKWRPPATDLDLGFYAVRFHDRSPVIYQYPGVGVNPATGQIGLYKLVYPENINAYGASASTTFGSVNVAGEVSLRRHATLVSDAQAVPPNAPADNNSNPLYAIGNTAHAQVSFLWAVDPNFIARESSLAAEVAWNRTLSVTKNPGAVDPNTQRDAFGLRLVYSPTYRQIMSGIDITVPVGFSYFPKGKSSAVANFGVDKGGDFTLGVAGSYLDVWRFSLSYTQFYGKEGTFLALGPTGIPRFSFAQAFKDRNFVALSFSRTF